MLTWGTGSILSADLLLERFSMSCVLTRRRRTSLRRRKARTESHLLELCRRPGLLAVLMAVDRFRAADAFGGLAGGVASGLHVGSATSLGLIGRLRGHPRRSLLRPRCTTLAPATDAGEERARSSNARARNGDGDDGSARGMPTLDVHDQSPAARRRAGSGKSETLAVARSSPTPARQGASDGILTFESLNSRHVDASRVRRSIVHYLGTARRLTSHQFLCLGMASSRHCDIHLVMEVCEMARSMGISTNVRFMTNLVNAASKKRRWVMAAQLLQLMRSYGVEPNDITFTSILSEMSKAKQHHMAAEMIQTENLQTSLDAYNALISGCASCRGYERAIGYFNDMVKAGVRPNGMTFSSLIATTRDGTDIGVERGFAVLQMMKEAGVRPNTYCMNSLMAVSVHARQPNTALEIFEEMEREGVPRDVVSYNTAIWACDKLGDSPRAVRLLRLARASSIVPDDFSYNSVISALGHSSMWQEAFRIFEEMHEVGVRPGLMTYNTLIAGCVRAEHPNEALSVFKVMKQRNIKRDQYSYAGALHACMHLRDFELSMTLVEEMEEEGMPANSMGYATAIRTCARCGKSFEAVQLYAKSLKLAIIPNKVTYKALLEAFAGEKSADKAAWVLDEMQDMQVDIEHDHLLTALAACTDEAGIALRILRLNADLNLHVAFHMHSKALEVCITAGDYEASQTAIDLMNQAGLQPEPEQERRMQQACLDLVMLEEARPSGLPSVLSAGEEDPRKPFDGRA